MTKRSHLSKTTANAVAKKLGLDDVIAEVLRVPSRSHGGRLDQRDLRALHRDVGAGAHGDADVSVLRLRRVNA